ncbi:MAG: family 78 glycoside hydrolase catalytic domain [Eubacteriales bacterium]|nr:family 78 glycoside hydrolase catalytic domain [Eubacteriales bacterium]
MSEEKIKQWITNGTDRPFYARKAWKLESLPKRAVINVCGLGQFQFFVNGEKVSDHVLDPAWTDYRKIIYYLTFDITDMLVCGENVLAAEVGNGWFLMDDNGKYVFHFPPFMPPNPNEYQPFGQVLMLAARLMLTWEDGREEVLCADESWKTAPHMILHSNVFGSETVDGRRRMEHWNDTLCKDETWENARLVRKEEVPGGILCEQTIPATKVIQTYEGQYLHTVNDRVIYDFTQNTSGMLELEVIGKRGDVIYIYPAEKLDRYGDADQMAKNWMPINVCETYVIGSDDTWEHFAMTFTYFGGRYIAVEGCSAARLRNVRLRAISSAGENAGSFVCDDERYMQIYSLIERAVEANMVGVHTDCPTIERFAWQEENHLMAPAIMYMKRVDRHWEKFLTDTRLSQHTGEEHFHDGKGGEFYPGEGLIPSQAPCYMPNVLPVPGMGSFYDVIGWGSSIILGTWWHYQFYGSREIIEENYEAGKRYLAYLKTKVNADGFINHGLGDWGNPAGEFACENVETAFLYADARILAEFAAILGKKEDAESIAQYAAQVKKHYNEKLLVYDETRGCWCYRVWSHPEEIFMTQASEAMPLFWGMVPEDVEADVVKSLRKTVEDAGAFQSGEVGLPYIIQAMAQHGMNDLICRLVLRETHPGYYAFVRAGETTLGEYWEENPRSHCHDMMGHIAEWYYNGIAGIRIREAGFKRVLIKPYLPESMNQMQCIYQCASGEIKVSMKRCSREIDLKVETAPGIEAEIDRTYLQQQ